MQSSVRRRFSCFALLLLALAQPGCYVLRPSSGGGQTDFSPPRLVNPADVLVPEGYRIEAVATGLTYPTAISFDAMGQLHVLEGGYSYGEDWSVPRLLRMTDSGFETIAEGGSTGPWTGATFYDGHFYITAADVLESGKILRVSADGAIDILLDGIPSAGDHHLNAPIVGPDGHLYFAIGTVTNSGVVGEDNAKMGWLARHPQLHDIPGQDIAVRDLSFAPQQERRAPKGPRTSAFAPFGLPAQEERLVPGEVLASGSVVRLPLGGGDPELVAWGFRNPFGLAFAPDGALYATENGYDDRGARPVWGAADHLWRVEEGIWYGWPDYSGDSPLAASHFKPPGKPQPEFLLAHHPNYPPPPVARFPVHSSANGLDFSTSSAFGHRGEAFVAQFGDLAPEVAKVMAPVGFKVVRVKISTGEIEEFAVNRGKTHGPASRFGGGGLERPVAATFSPDGRSLYLVDFGVVTVQKGKMTPHPRTGVVWRIWKEES